MGSCLLWSVWKARNSLIFEKKCVQINAVLRQNLYLKILLQSLSLRAGYPRLRIRKYSYLCESYLGRFLHTQFQKPSIGNLVIVFKLMTGKQEDPCLHEDWFSAVIRQWFILTGCYDGFGRYIFPAMLIFNFITVWKGGSCTHILEGHGDAVTSVSIINYKGAKSILTTHVATASKDMTVRLWKFDADEPTNNVRDFKILQGHSSSVQSVAPQPSREMDSTTNLWRTIESDSDSVLVSVKKRKVNSKAEESQLEGEAVNSLVGHTQCVSFVVWPEERTIYSASWDHSFRSWDVKTGRDVLSFFCGKVLNDLDVGGDSSALIAADGSDPVLRIWDPRKSGSSAPVLQFASHSSWITACKWHDSLRKHLLSSKWYMYLCSSINIWVTGGADGILKSPAVNTPVT
ncbi:hypothetical protein MKW92_042591 [Papaver armeniacum]|nr:hypothetical protein MKW92_042591 [Papaver armeniacum]